MLRNIILFSWLETTWYLTYILIVTICLYLFVYSFIYFFIFCRDISFLYDATVPEKTDSTGKSLVTPASDKSKTSPGNKQLELVEKNKGESSLEAMVKFRIEIYLET